MSRQFAAAGSWWRRCLCIDTSSDAATIPRNVRRFSMATFLLSCLMATSCVAMAVCCSRSRPWRIRAKGDERRESDEDHPTRQDRTEVMSTKTCGFVPSAVSEASRTTPKAHPNRQRPSRRRGKLAERVGFEPTCRLRDKTLSRRPRYDHFGTSPVVCVGRAEARRYVLCAGRAPGATYDRGYETRRYGVL